MSAFIPRDPMLEMMNLVFTGGEVKRMKPTAPAAVDVNVEIKNVTKKDAAHVHVDFVYSIDYKPKVAWVKLFGFAYCNDTPENIKKILAEFKKKKNISLDHAARLINVINANAGMNAVFMLRPFAIVPPFMPPPMIKEPAPSKTAKPKKKKK